MKKYFPLVIFVGTMLVFVLIGCFFLYLLGPAEEEIFSAITEEIPSPNQLEASMNLTSPAFSQGQYIPAKFSCNGADVSPALVWTKTPSLTKSFALIMDDPDAPMGTWVHWVIFNIPATAHALPEGIPTSENLPDGSVQGITSARKVGYHGPCPPSGTHRYFFKLYALDTMLDLSSSADKKAVLAAMEGHIIVHAELMGMFGK
jgi:Raf kinase inhibitor-like YbhB/YbcL family protein